MCNVLLSSWSKSKVRGGAKSKNKQPSWLYCTVVRLSGAANGAVRSIKEAVLKNFATSTWNTCVVVSLLKVAGLKICNFIKKRPQHRCFPVNIAKFLRLTISKNIGCFLIVLMVHCYMCLKLQGLDCMSGSDFMVRVFCF